MGVEAKQSRGQWLSPSAALQRFQPPAVLSMGSRVTATQAQQTRYGFRVGNLGLLIGPTTMSEVMEPLPVYPIPLTPPWLLGLVNLRGNLVPLFELKQLLELTGEPRGKPMLLVLDRGEYAVGMLIDGLPQIPALDRPLSRLPPLPTVLQPHAVRAYIHAGTVWVEFDHQGFFQAAAARLAT
ncbi:MAG: chemotaxis protein CheW [Candidatus Competibacteraceae bacterium]